MYCLNVVSVVFLLLGWVVFCLISRKLTTVSQTVVEIYFIPHTFRSEP